MFILSLTLSLSRSLPSPVDRVLAGLVHTSTTDRVRAVSFLALLYPEAAFLGHEATKKGFLLSSRAGV